MAGSSQPPAPEPLAESLSLALPHVTVAAQLHGPRDGVPVVALHGWLDNAASFSRLAAKLPGLRILALDLPGHGLSGHRPPGLGYHLWEYAHDVLMAAEALGWQRFSLLGHSMGAIVSVLLAGSMPERIARVGLIDGVLPQTGAPSRSPERLGQALRRSLRSRERKPLYPSIDDAVRARMGAGYPVSREAAERLTERGLVAIEGGFTWRSDPRLLAPTPMRLSDEHAKAFIAEVRCPVRLILAEQGIYADAAEQMAALPFECCWLPGGHHLHLDDETGADAVAAALLGFFSD
ncbi:alpha/beta fold hydrolase [Stutzerimonas tarimensis]|uniref:Alpha/beta fold hydrolase n=1 Tax=Stutzerimonas tarimensis TaxID=1507735 RepID=A0ABV7T7P3_9GAMM